MVPLSSFGIKELKQNMYMYCNDYKFSDRQEGRTVVLKERTDQAGRSSSIGCTSTWYADGHRFDPRVRQHSFMEFDHEIISTAILSFPLIQEGQLSFTG